MKQALKRVMCMVLVLALCMGLVPTVFATDQATTDSVVDIGDLSTEGTTAFGNLLAEEIDEAKTQEDTKEYESGYGLTNLEIVDGVATVTYDTLETANLVVAIYSEDGVKMVTSETVKVEPEETVATVTFTQALPTYFMAEAFLLDTYDYSPLCVSYDTPMYTKEMQDLLTSTVNDYDADLVLNLDENKETNFAVYKENVIQIPFVEGVNVVASMDDAAMTYVIKNADEQILSLQTGDIFVYEYAQDDLLIVKVGSITVNGTTVSIVGVDAEMEEIFSYVKVEGDASTEDVQVDTSTVAEDVTYVGLVEDGVQTYAWEDEGSARVALGYEFEFTSEKESKYLDAAVSLTGSVKVSLESTIKYYIALNKQYMEWRLEPALTFGLEVSGEVAGKVPIGNYGISPCPGVYVGLEPHIKLGFEGKLEVSLKTSMTIGFRFQLFKGFTDLTTTPKTELGVEVEGKIVLGVDWTPYVRVIDEKIATVEAEMFTGFELSAKMSGGKLSDFEEGDKTKHACERCLDMTLSFKSEIGGKVKFLNRKFLTFEIDLANWSLKLGDLYYSFDESDFGWGKCPYKEYRLTVQAKDADGKALSKIAVTVDGKAIDKTNKKGTTIAYLSKGKHTVKAMINGKECKKTVDVKAACKVTLKPNGSSSEVESDALDHVNENTVIDRGTIIYDNTANLLNGKIETTAAGVNIYRDADGVFTIEKTKDNDAEVGINLGEGLLVSEFSHMSLSIESTVPFDIVMYDKNNSFWISIASNFYPHFSEDSTGIAIQPGVYQLMMLDILNVYKWNDIPYKNALLKSVYIVPKGAGKIRIKEMVMFGGNGGVCGDHARWKLDDDGVLHILGYGPMRDYVSGNSPWYELRNDITAVVIEDTITRIGDAAFYECEYITTAVLPDLVTEIGYRAFSNCSSLKTIRFPEGLITIDERAFEFCSSLTSITIPNSVLGLRKAAFSYCSNLKYAILGNGIQIFDEILFFFCFDLSDIYYTGTKEQWDRIVCFLPNDELLDATLHYNYTSSATVLNSGTVENTESYFAVVGGTYETVFPENGTAYKTASFKNLVPAQQYILLVLGSVDVTEKLANTNLLYIEQNVATEDGTLKFNYIPAKDVAVSYVMVCGASDKNLNDAEITVVPLVSSDTACAVDITVVYDGETLVEDEDYVIVSGADYTEAGVYTCIIRGIYDYTGTVEYTYTVNLLGDVTFDSVLNTSDVVRILRAALEFEEYDERYFELFDYNEDGKLNTLDARYTLKAIVNTSN